jgi:hypothetical protein
MGGLDKEFKYHLVSWSKICSLISERVGGSEFADLQLCSLRKMALALGPACWRSWSITRSVWREWFTRV